MSDWQAGDLAQQHWVGDLENVVDAAGLAAPFALLGISQGAATSLRYAVRHPERVSHLILYGGYAVGGHRNDEPQRRALFNAGTIGQARDRDRVSTPGEVTGDAGTVKKKK